MSKPHRLNFYEHASLMIYPCHKYETASFSKLTFCSKWIEKIEKNQSVRTVFENYLKMSNLLGTYTIFEFSRKKSNFEACEIITNRRFFFHFWSSFSFLLNGLCSIFIVPTCCQDTHARSTFALTFMEMQLTWKSKEKSNLVTCTNVIVHIVDLSEW